jgi:hypothetical protein
MVVEDKATEAQARKANAIQKKATLAQKKG